MRCGFVTWNWLNFENIFLIDRKRVASCRRVTFSQGIAILQRGKTTFFPDFFLQFLITMRKFMQLPQEGWKFEGMKKTLLSLMLIFSHSSQIYSVTFFTLTHITLYILTVFHLFCDMKKKTSDSLISYTPRKLNLVQTHFTSFT